MSIQTGAKYGGTSQGTLEALNNSAQATKYFFERHGNMFVVVSAAGGITDMLLEGVDEQRRIILGGGSVDKAVDRFQNVTHPSIVAKYQEKFGLDTNLMEIVNERLRILHSLGESIRQVDVEDPAQFAYYRSLIARWGEQTQNPVFTAYLNGMRIPARSIPTEGIIDFELKENPFRVEYVPSSDEKIRAAFNDGFRGISVIGGYYGRAVNENAPVLDGNVPVLVTDRGGSDWTEMLVGRALGVDFVFNCTDVEGVKPIDPKKLTPGEREHLRTIMQMPYGAAQELTLHGGKVLHPHAVETAEKASMTIYVLSTENPSGDSTSISAVAEDTPQILAVSGKPDLNQITLRASQMAGGTAYARTFFTGLSDVDITDTYTSEVEMRATTSEGFAKETIESRLGDMGTVSFDNQSARLAIVGTNIGQNAHLIARFFDILGDKGIPVGPVTKSNDNVMSVMIPNDRLDDALRDVYFGMIQ